MYIDTNTQEKPPEEWLLMVVIHVDDLFTVGPNTKVISQVKTELETEFKMSDLGGMKEITGMQIEQLNDGSIFLHQSRYIKKILIKYGMENCNPVSTPATSGVIPSDIDVDVHEYLAINRSICWAATMTRPDISYIAGWLGRSNTKPTTAHTAAQKRVLRYLRGTADYGILYSSQSKKGLCGYADSDWAGDTTDRKSTTGNLWELGDAAIGWTSRKQPTVALSTVEGEYMAAAETLKDGLWLAMWLEEIGIPKDLIFPL
jgi:hypothetical protein